MSSGAGNTACIGANYLKSTFGTALGVGFYVRAYIRFDDLPTGRTCVFSLGNSGGNYSILASVNATGDVDMRYNGNSLVQGNTVAGLITSNTNWYRFELYSNTNSGGADDSVALYVDGVQIDLRTNVDAGVTLASDTFELGWRTAPGANKVLHFDDVAVNIDTAAAFNPNSFPGPGQVVMHLPVADISRVGWTGGAGGTTDLFNALDNIPPVGVALASATNTSQIKDLANNATDEIQVAVQSLNDLGVPLNAQIRYSQVYADVGPDPSTLDSYTVTPEVNPTGASRTADIFQADQAATWPSGWSGVHGTALVAPTIGHSVRPEISLTKATASGTVTQQCDALVLLTEYLDIGSILSNPFIHRGGRGAGW